MPPLFKYEVGTRIKSTQYPHYSGVITHDHMRVDDVPIYQIKWDGFFSIQTWCREDELEKE